MSEMVERVAQAMFDSLIVSDGAYTLAQGSHPSCITLDGCFDLRGLARTAIVAMREPTEAMVYRGIDDAGRSVRVIYSAMIDAALVAPTALPALMRRTRPPEDGPPSD